MNKFGQSLKAAAFAATLLAGVGVAGEAQALTIGNGDLVLVMYNNNTQLLQNLGQTSSYFAPGSTATINLASSDVAAASGTNPVKWALVSFLYDETSGEATTLAASSSKNLSAWTPTELSQVSIVNSWNTAASWAAQHSGVYPGGPTQLISAADGLAYTNPSWFGTDGSMASGFPVSTEGFFGSTLAALQGDMGNNLTQLGSASLSGDGLTLLLAGVSGPAPVPVPAAVILFGTGLAGLVGVARRKLIAA